MSTYVAHYSSLASSNTRAKGLFEFESDARMGSKANLYDARMKMLETFGKDAVSWTIDKVERKTQRKEDIDGQLELDFRAPKPERKRKNKKEWW